MRAVPAVIVCLAAALAPTAPVWAGVQDWQVSEVLVAAGGDPDIRYIELSNPAGGCMFPSTRVEVYGADGAALGAVAPVAATTCFGPGTYYLLATSDAAAHFGTTADEPIVPAIPAGAGQICFTSSTTRYDCVRWGAIAQPVVDFYGGGDTSAAVAPPDGQALSRVDTTHVVAADWSILAPTPRGPNDGTPWDPPDAGGMPDAGMDAGMDAGGDAGLPDAGLPDAGLPDAGLPDAAGPADARGDARVPPRFLDLDPVGGAACGCRVGGRARGQDRLARHLPLAALALVALVALRRRRRV